MREFIRSTRNLVKFLVVVSTVFVAQFAQAQTPQSVQSFRGSFSVLMDNFEQVFRQEGNMRGLDQVARARVAMMNVQDQDLARIVARPDIPDLAPALSAMQRLNENSQRQMRSLGVLKSAGLPGAGSIIGSCVSTTHDDQSTYDALIAYNVTSAILSAATFVCTQDILGENGSAACIPLAIANAVAAGIFSTRSFCGSVDTGATISGGFERLGHIHDDLTTARGDIMTNVTNSTTSINNNINASTTSIINNDNTNKNTLLASIAASTTAIVNNANSNTTTIVNNDNANRALVVGELRALGCEIVRLLNTPDGLRASSILQCSAQPGFPYKWNK